eukprot:349604-Chlamydomonas_euryale.AAC.9
MRMGERERREVVGGNGEAGRGTRVDLLEKVKEASRAEWEMGKAGRTRETVVDTTKKLQKLRMGRKENCGRGPSRMTEEGPSPASGHDGASIE